MKFTPDNITELGKNQIFTFGSNESGIHGAGAALLAKEKFGAKYGVGFGLQGQSFAIPSKNWSIQALDLEVINFYVSRFIAFAKARPDFEFLITRIGCGLANLGPKDIAPMFRSAINLPNCVLPRDFCSVLGMDRANRWCGDSDYPYTD